MSLRLVPQFGLELPTRVLSCSTQTMGDAEDHPYVVRVRLSERLMERVDARLRNARERHPGHSTTQSDVIRDVLWKGFASEDDDE